ncbi:hypothetical protein [Streptomyces melanogenes]|nr:hypothetical protein [Streptomyces melanogenes]GGP91649.1 hypothetical protein GCM10010278_82280 [Streptomyces melanogenes]
MYNYPLRANTEVTQVSSWVRADRAELDGPLYDAVTRWLSSA